MLNATVTKVEDIPKLKHDEAMELAKTEYQRFTDLLRTLQLDDWNAATDCVRWDVSGVVSHLIAMSQMVAGFPLEMGRQQKAAKPLIDELGLSKFDAWTEHQSKMHGTGAGLVAKYEELYPRALRRRERFAKVLRPVKIPQPPYGWWSFRYLIDDILTRDVWMHRVDISRATGRDIVVTPEHDGRFVANIVRDLGENQKRPFTLVLSGPAGGHFVHGTGSDEIKVDAVEFCRILSGRSSGHGLPTDVVPF